MINERLPIVSLLCQNAVLQHTAAYFFVIFVFNGLSECFICFLTVVHDAVIQCMIY